MEKFLFYGLPEGMVSNTDRAMKENEDNPKNTTLS